MNADFNAQGELVARADAKPSAGAFEATSAASRAHPGAGAAGAAAEGGLRELPASASPHATEPGVKFAYPPLPWIGARFKWEVRELDGNKVLAKTLDNIFFQRATVFIGHPDAKNYTFEADVMTDGNRRRCPTSG